MKNEIMDTQIRHAVQAAIGTLIEDDQPLTIDNILYFIEQNATWYTEPYAPVDKRIKKRAIAHKATLVKLLLG